MRENEIRRKRERDEGGKKRWIGQVWGRGCVYYRPERVGCFVWSVRLKRSQCEGFWCECQYT